MEAREGEQEVGDPDRPRPEVLHIEIPRWPGWAGEEVRWVVAPAPTGGAAWVVGKSYGSSVSIQSFAEARAELREGGSVRPGQGFFFWGDWRWLSL